MSAWRGFFGRRPSALAAAGVLAVLMSGDRAQLAPPAGVGIDPFEVLDQQVRNNVLILIDSSAAMKSPVDRDSFSIGGDDPASRLYQVKQALQTVITANQGRVNFGMATFNVGSDVKTLNRTQDVANDGRADGPFVYVTADGVAAAPFFTNLFPSSDDLLTPAENEACPAGVNGYFCSTSNTFLNYDDTVPGPLNGDVWRSFMNRGFSAYPTGCSTAASTLSPVDPTNPGTMRCRFYLQSRLLRDRVRFTFSRLTNNPAARLVAIQNLPNNCGTAPPFGLLPHMSSPPCFQIQDGVGGPSATYWYTGTLFQAPDGSSCEAPNVVSPIQTCSPGNLAVMSSRLAAELPIAGDGLNGLSGVPNPPGTATFDYADGHLDGDNLDAEFGIRADQATSIHASLNGILNAGTPAFPSQAGPGQKNVVILVTAGDDDCADPNKDRAAVMAADAAEALYDRFDPVNNTGDFQHWAETIVVAFGSGVTPARANVIAKGGSGADIDGASSNPATAATCGAGVPCRDALFAANRTQLLAALNAAIDKAALSGLYSATPSVFDAVPEFVDQVPPSPFPSPFSVMNPETRYRASAFRSYRAFFDASDFKGYVRGSDDFGPMVPNRPAPAPSVERAWEAGQRLIDRVSADLDPATATGATFTELVNGSFVPAAGVSVPIDGQGKVRRRIISTRQNGRRLSNLPDLEVNRTGTCSTGPCRVNLWPPDADVAPATLLPGAVDTRLFRKSDGTQMLLADLQAPPLNACRGTLPATHPCTTSPLAASQREAREMILAFTAGAEPLRTGAGYPVRNSSGDILYRRRPWLLAESTVGSPALVTPPLTLVPANHAAEYFLYRDGPRDLPSGQASGGDTDLFIRKGFGLRNPDKDGKEAPVGNLTRTNLKPEMSIVYVPANDMLHAFRAGPCPTGVSICDDETGGEELFAFVPHDLLPRLKDRMKPQTRADHTYMLASSLRFADVFLPGSYSLPVTGRTYNLTGRWRRVLMFGRGMGGKHYTALDITGLGSFTSPALATQLPVVLWNRGNPDTIDGLPTGTRSGTTSEFTLYLDMGLTWSTPGIGRVRPTANNGGREFVAFTGSGYSASDPREGTRFYTLDPFTGDIFASANVFDSASQPAFQNALVANPVLYSGARLVAGVDLPHPSGAVTESVFIGDIHGRMWKFDATAPGTAILFRDLGPTQPIGVAAGLLNLNAPFVFVETGADARVAAPATGFKAFALKDGGTLPAEVVFTQDFPTATATNGPYRGTLQPVTAFRGSIAGGEGVVFFTATRFNAAPPGGCASSFDTIVYGLTGSTGGPAYDTTEYTGVKAVGVPRPPVPPAAGEPPPVDQGTSQPGQEPESAPVKPSTVGTPAVVRSDAFRPGSPVCR